MKQDDDAARYLARQLQAHIHYCLNCRFVLKEVKLLALAKQTRRFSDPVRLARQLSYDINYKLYRKSVESCVEAAKKTKYAYWMSRTVSSYLKQVTIRVLGEKKKKKRADEKPRV